MTENTKSDTPSEKKSFILPAIVLSIVGLGLTLFCIFGILLNLNSDQFNFSSSSSPTSIPTTTFTQTVVAPPTPNPEVQFIATQSASKWNTVITDTFNSNENLWYLGNTSTDDLDSNLEIKDGKYLWSVFSKKSIFTSSFPTRLEPVRNFHVSADVKLTSGRYRTSYGLVFRANEDVSTGYHFLIWGDKFIVSRIDAQSFIFEPTPSVAILPQETNRLTVIAENDHFTLFINDQYVGEFTDDTHKEGMIGFTLGLYDPDLQNSFEFDNFEIRLP